MSSDLYRVKYYNSMGYVVYRHCWAGEAANGPLEHRTAIFVTELEANQYAAHRNLLTLINGSDALPQPS